MHWQRGDVAWRATQETVGGWRSHEKAGVASERNRAGPADRQTSKLRNENESVERGHCRRAGLKYSKLYKKIFKLTL